MKFLWIVMGALAATTALSAATPAHATEKRIYCDAQNKKCVAEELQSLAAEIDNKSWRDQTYRELAKSYTHAGMEDAAIALIGRIETPDTKAMTIRGIGFAAADGKWTQERYDRLWATLSAEAKKITHAPSQGIAWTYIAMAQAFAKNDDAATKTALAMENEALRHKALAENAEIQAQRGDFTAAMASIGHIGSASFRNKAYRIVAKIFTDDGRLQDAYRTAGKIDNSYTRAQVLQAILNHGNAEEKVKVDSEE